MKDNQEHISIDFTNGKINLPLYNFFIALKQNNFLVTPKQIADSNSIIDAYSESVQNEMELCHYLSPIFANSHEEQIQFKELFEQYFAPVSKKPEADFLHNKQKIPDHFKQHWWKYILAVAFIVAALLYFLRKPLLHPRPSISITANPADSVTTVLSKQTNAAFNLPVKTQLNINNKLPDSVPGIKLKTTYNWGDNSAVDTLPYHEYTKEGNYKITAYPQIFYKNYYQYTDTVFTDVAICFSTNQFTIEKSFKTDSVKIGDTVKLTAGITGKQPDSIIWASINDHKIIPANHNKTVSIIFNKEETETFYFTAVYDSINAPCNGKAAITFFVYDPAPKPQIKFSVPPGAKPLPPQFKVHQNWFYLLLFLAGLFLVLTSFFALRWKRSKKNDADNNSGVKKEYEKLLQSFSGKAGAVDLPFLNKNYLPLPEPALADVARQMRKRISDEAQYLHLQKTIAKAIDNAGFFQPVQVARTQQSEYLILIDEQNSNNQQVKLFEYLLELLQKQNVFIEKFYFQQEPKWCYNLTYPQGISLEKLSEKFPKHVLLILGNGYQLIYKDYPVIDNSYLQYLRRWQYKAVVTPVSFLDWGNKEKKALLDELPVLPVDIPGQLLLLQKLFGEEINVLADLKLYSKGFYETELIDFEDVDELYEYCENAVWARVNNGGRYDNILFQWIAALAVYPKITWQLTLALGKAIMDTYGKTHELNFTTLLRIARIKWMKDGKFPDYTRLNLLKNLSKQNEVVAREHILMLLNEIPDADLTGEHFAYEEKETQRLINEFNLYAFDPVKYAGYKKSKDLLAQLWHHQQITDTPAQAYLENKDLQWQTIINKPATNASVAENISLPQYFDSGAAANTFLKSIYLWCAAISALLFSAALIGLILLAVLNFTAKKNIFPFTYKQSSNKTINFIFSDSSGSTKKTSVPTTGSKELPTGNVVLVVDTFETRLYSLDTARLVLPVDDSAKAISVSAGNTIMFDTTINIAYDAYNITLRPAKQNDIIKLPDSVNNPPAVLPANLHEIWQGKTNNRLVNIDLRKKLIYYSTADEKTYGTYPITAVNKTKLGSYKVIATTSKGSNVMFIRNVSSSSFEFAGCQMLVQDKAEIDKIDENNCGNFDVMGLYYEKQTPGNIYLPVTSVSGQAKSLMPAELKKLYAYTANYNAKLKNFTISLKNNIRFLPRFAPNYIAAYLANAGVKVDVGEIVSTSIDVNTATPFKRNFFTIDIAASNPFIKNTRQSKSRISTRGVIVDSTVTVPAQKNTIQPNTTNAYAPPIKKILWVDDNALNNALLVDYFKKADYRVDVVSDNQTALDFIKKNNYEIIITDITRNNKKESGIDLLKNLPANFNKGNVIIYTSPLSEKKYAKQIKAMGYNKIFTKAADLINATDQRQYRQSF